ncbi:MAG: hypothetical protein JWQ69_610, partial [Pseudomonas sp.]|nr:hypothetical protein [Pseudomonas sp.]
FLTKINMSIKRFIQRKEGASAIEYAIIVAMVALILFGMIGPMGTAVKGKYNEIISALGGTPAP